MRRIRNLVTTAALVAVAFVSTLGAASPANAGSGFTAGDLAIGFGSTAGGVCLESLRDVRRGQEWCATNPPPLFRVTLRSARGRNEARLEADRGWRQTSISRTGDGFRLRWSAPVAAELHGIAVTATARADRRHNAWRWKLVVENRNRAWGVASVNFPQVALREPPQGGSVLFPRGPGEVQTNAWRRVFNYHGDYPGGWCCMQFLAAYGTGADPSGLYLAVQDPWGGVKSLGLETDPGTRTVRLGFEQPAPNLGVGGTGFEQSGELVVEMFRGDWFDAAGIYKAWARANARWWPRLGRDGRPDTPLWMRELSAWVMTGGAPADCQERVERFQRFLGLPVGFHWYNWHQIPFDNDYPHYFPAKPGFAEAVRDLEANRVYPMPYINGRLWDTHDQGTNDFEFTRLALPAATKQDNGQPYVERYGSKETNGERVALAVMCPATTLWQDTVRGIVLRLLNEVGTSAVYIDQVAAAPPKLCMDPRHGHPLGGGHWWNQGYWRMLARIRRGMAANAALTTECNGEPFVNVFDGYLTWHWQYNGQVPAFPAVYGGAVQMFGRAYRGGPTQNLALRMKAGQQFVFGEQIGWFDPDVIDNSANAAFLRDLIRMRWRLRRYFYAGEMARPPKLDGPTRTVTADWQWSGRWPVTTEAVLTGAWEIPREQRLVLLFVNVSDQPATVSAPFDPVTYGLAGRELAWNAVATGPGGRFEDAVARGLPAPIILPARTARVWEARW